ncbi:MAG: hypothetical protein NUV74_08935 [Candidatus Brocadiaceae bacterium]|nr:hypothetical protein [Candidatus Brocadiaceae bacterium]
MQSATLKKEAKKAIDKLSEEKVSVAIDFIDYLKEKTVLIEAIGPRGDIYK